MKVDGQCHCGQIHYEAQIDADKVSAPKVYALRVGTMSQRAALPAKRQIWCRSALSWATDIRGLERSERA